MVVSGVNMEMRDEFDPETSLFAPKFTTKSTPQPLHFTHVSPIDPTLDRRTDVRWEERDGRMVRISEESGAEVPLPPRKQEADSALKEYAEGLCTRKADVLEVTYKPLPAFTVRRHAEEPAVTTSASGDAAGNGATVS